MNTEDTMDFPYATAPLRFAPAPRRPIAVWLLVALIGLVLGAAALAAAVSTDTRDFATRHGTVLRTQAL
jgi:hypothetical protein